MNDDRFDDLARRAAAELRRPAPDDGIAQLQRARRRRAARITGVGIAAAIALVGTITVLTRTGGNNSVVGDTPAPSTEQTAPDRTQSTPAPTTTTESGGNFSSRWSVDPEPFPLQAYTPCCGEEYRGDASPQLPIDGASTLEPGIYHATLSPSDLAEGGLDDGVANITLKGFADCFTLQTCGPDAEIDQLVLLDTPAYDLQLQLDDTLTVRVEGFDCSTDQLLTDRQIATGVELRELLGEYYEDFRTAVIQPLSAGADQDDVLDDLRVGDDDGFRDPECPAWSDWAWRGSTGPGLWPNLILPADGSVPSQAFAPFLRVTAFEVLPDGTQILYVYGGFLS